MASAEVQIELLTAGSCTHPAWVVTGRLTREILTFPSLVGLVRHPTRGLVLFDAGYAPRFFERTKIWPQRLYRHVTPVRCSADDSVAAQLRARGHDPDDVALIVLSHFHADHVGGLLDFPRAKLLYRRGAVDRDVHAWSVWRHLRAGMLPGLLPADLFERAEHVEDRPVVDLGSDHAPFTRAWDLFGDGSLLGLDLAGHARAQLGILLRHTQGPEVFLVADAAWRREAIEDLRFPSPVVRLITEDMRLYRRRIRDLHALAGARPDPLVVPSHCEDSIEQARVALGG